MQAGFAWGWQVARGALAQELEINANEIEIAARGLRNPAIMVLNIAAEGLAAGARAIAEDTQAALATFVFICQNINADVIRAAAQLTVDTVIETARDTLHEVKGIAHDAHHLYQAATRENIVGALIDTTQRLERTAIDHINTATDLSYDVAMAFGHADKIDTHIAKVHGVVQAIQDASTSVTDTIRAYA